jgi:hypothetical protein
MAMNNTITAAHVQQFHDSFVAANEQKESRLEQTVTSRGSITGSSFTANDMGTVEAREVTNRYGDTEWSLPDVGVRQALMTDYDIAIPIEKTDLPKLLANPQGDYMQRAIAAMNRKKDAVIYNALVGSALRKTSDSGAYAGVALPSAQKILAGGAGMTKAKLLLAKKLFRKNEADAHAGEELFIAYDAEMMEDILSDTTLTSADFMAAKMLQEGDVSGKWLGFKWVPYEALTDTGSQRTTPVWTKTALHFGKGADIETDIGPRRDKRNLIQIYVNQSLAAVRVNEQKVVTIDFLY